MKRIASSTFSALIMGKMGPNISSNITASDPETCVTTCKSRNRCTGSRSFPRTILPIFV